jgi:hypothetical protein
MQRRRWADIQIVLAALLFSTDGAAIKACALGSWQVASFRSGIAAAAILLFVPAIAVVADASLSFCIAPD